MKMITLIQWIDQLFDEYAALMYAYNEASGDLMQNLVYRRKCRGNRTT